MGVFFSGATFQPRDLQTFLMGWGFGDFVSFRGEIHIISRKHFKVCRFLEWSAFCSRRCLAKPQKNPLSP